MAAAVCPTSMNRQPSEPSASSKNCGASSATRAVPQEELDYFERLLRRN